ncbi:hypothetical protein RBA09_00525 [Massilia sp. CCM 9029]|nr:hypothetical protein [Massilia sp. CCM 9029]MDQ1829225.1 hypothetical protein [Massilia sp. CCM 9029]
MLTRRLVVSLAMAMHGVGELEAGIAVDVGNQDRQVVGNGAQAFFVVALADFTGLALADIERHGEKAVGIAVGVEVRNIRRIVGEQAASDHHVTLERGPGAAHGRLDVRPDFGKLGVGISHAHRLPR